MNEADVKFLNTSGLRPLGSAVLVEPYEPDMKKGMIALPDSVSERSAMIETRAVVVEVGPEAWKSEALPRASAGDRVMISRYAGVVVKGAMDGKTYRMVNANDVFCQITEEKSHG